MTMVRSLVVVSSLLLLGPSAAQDFKPQERDSRNAFPELTIGDFKKCQDILKTPFPLLARWNTEMLSEKPDLKLCVMLKDSSAAAVMAIPAAPKKSVQFVVKNGLDMIQKNQAYVLNAQMSGSGVDLPEAKVAKAKANNQRVLQNMRNHLRQVAIALDGVPGFELKEPRVEKAAK
jgi:hypothetical protein